MKLLGYIARVLFDCHHPNVSRVFTINHRSYQVCCECGAEFDYSFQTMSARRVRLKRSSCGHFTLQTSSTTTA